MTTIMMMMMTMRRRDLNLFYLTLQWSCSQWREIMWSKESETLSRECGTPCVRWGTPILFHLHLHLHLHLSLHVHSVPLSLRYLYQWISLHLLVLCDTNLSITHILLFVICGMVCPSQRISAWSVVYIRLSHPLSFWCTYNWPAMNFFVALFILSISLSHTALSISSLSQGMRGRRWCHRCSTCSCCRGWWRRRARPSWSKGNEEETKRREAEKNRGHRTSWR